MASFIAGDHVRKKAVGGFRIDHWQSHVGDDGQLSRAARLGGTDKFGGDWSPARVSVFRCLVEPAACVGRRATNQAITPLAAPIMEKGEGGAVGCYNACRVAIRTKFPLAVANIYIDLNASIRGGSTTGCRPPETVYDPWRQCIRQ
jgi:hypothetical protein